MSCLFLATALDGRRSLGYCLPMNAATPTTPVLTAGCTLEVLKGTKEMWVQSTTGRPAHHAKVQVRDHLRVVAAEEIADKGFRVTIERAHDRFTVWARSGAWTRHPEFNLRSLMGVTIRVCVIKRPVAVEVAS